MLRANVLELGLAGAALRLSRDQSSTNSSLRTSHDTPGTQDGHHFRTLDLAHVGVSLQRKVVVGGKQFQDNAAFVKKHKLSSIPLAQSILQDMASATDVFDFQNEQELQIEIVKRSSTVKHMEESQANYFLGGAFAYPFSESNRTELYGPRVNYAAREYWEPAVPDNYGNRDIKTSATKNAQLLHSKRSERYRFYGDQQLDTDGSCPRRNSQIRTRLLLFCSRHNRSHAYARSSTATTWSRL